MRLDDFGQSDNVKNRRGEGGGPSLGGGGGGALLFMLIRMVMNRFGIGGVVVVGIGFFLLSSLGINPLSSGGSTSQTASSAPTSQYDRLIGAVLLSTENVFTEVFREEGLGDYPEPILNLFAGRVTTRGCGSATSAVGPFYCPADSEVYIDTSFFDELGQRFGAPGDFAQAYVIAHEVGHHIQNATGVSAQVRSLQQRAQGDAERNEYSVRLELMADCLAGVWAGRTQIQLDPGDIDEALRAANAIGDDTLQRNAGGRVVPDSFTHGTSEQRQRWFTAGYQARDISACDTLNAARL